MDRTPVFTAWPYHQPERKTTYPKGFKYLCAYIDGRLEELTGGRDDRTSFVRGDLKPLDGEQPVFVMSSRKGRRFKAILVSWPRGRQGHFSGYICLPEDLEDARKVRNEEKLALLRNS